MSRLFLIRHGEPEEQWGGGDPDPGLSERGRAQAAAAAAALSRLGKLKIVSSPMRRCIETAAPFATRSDVAIVMEPRVSEAAAPGGIADRRAWLQEAFPWRAGSDPQYWGSLDAALRQWREGVLGAVRAHVGDIAIFTHFIAINAIVGHALAREETIVCRPGFASVTALECVDGALRMLRHGADMSEGEVR